MSRTTAVFCLLMLSSIFGSTFASAAGHPVVLRNTSSQCEISVAIAYVPFGETNYVVRGWWDKASGEGWDLLWDSGGSPIIIDGDLPWYFFVDRKGGKRTGRVAAFRKFEIDEEVLEFTQYPGGTDAGIFMLQPSCVK